MVGHNEDLIARKDMSQPVRETLPLVLALSWRSPLWGSWGREEYELRWSEAPRVFQGKQPGPQDITLSQDRALCGRAAKSPVCS